MHARHFTRWGLLGALAAAALVSGACERPQDSNGPYPYRNRAAGYTPKEPRFTPGDPRYNVTAQQSPGSVDPVNPQPATTTAMEQGTGGGGDINAVMMRKDPTGGTGAGGGTATDPATWRPRETSPEFVLQAPDGSFKQNNHTGGPAPLMGAPERPVPAPPVGNSPQALQRGSQDLGPERLPSGSAGTGATGPSQPVGGSGAPGTLEPHSDTGGSMKEPAEQQDKPNTSGAPGRESTGTSTGAKDKESIRP